MDTRSSVFPTRLRDSDREPRIRRTGGAQRLLAPLASAGLRANGRLLAGGSRAWPRTPARGGRVAVAGRVADDPAGPMKRGDGAELAAMGPWHKSAVGFECAWKCRSITPKSGACIRSVTGACPPGTKRPASLSSPLSRNASLGTISPQIGIRAACPYRPLSTSSAPHDLEVTAHEAKNHSGRDVDRVSRVRSALWPRARGATFQSRPILPAIALGSAPRWSLYLLGRI